jgi:hypothetical protein
MSISRRTFLKSSAAATALTMTAGAAKTVLGETTSATFAPGPGNTMPGNVVINFNKDAVTGTTTIGDAQITVIKKMVDESIMALAEKATVGEAWKAIFPSGLKATSKITIKTNFYTTSKCRVHWSVVQAMTEGLQKMDFGGTTFPAANITIFEACCPAANTMDSAGYTAANFPGITRNIDTNNMVTGSDAAKGESNGYAASLKNADYFLHVFGLRGHSNSYAEGVTLGGKSHYGTYSNKSPAHAQPGFSVRCANMMASGVVYNKLVLSVCAGLLSNNKGAGINDEPTDYSTYAKKMDPNCTTKATSTIIMSTDPVTTDMQAVKVMQMNKGGNYGVSDMPKYVQAIGGVSGAVSGVSYNIGKVDEKDMTIKKIINGGGTNTIGGANRTANAAGEYSLHVSPLNGQGIVFVDYIVPTSRQGDRAVLSMYDMLGNLVFSKEQTVHGVMNQFAWDRKTAQGKTLARGKYVCRLTVGKINRSAAFSII